MENRTCDLAFTRTAGIALLVLAAAACGHHHSHPEAERVEIESRGAQRILLAAWTADDGWTDGDGSALFELPAPVDVEGEGLQPLEAGGQRASLTVRFFDHDGDEVEMATLSRDDATGERQCTEVEARYFPTDDETSIIAWPNVRHPESTDGPFHFAERSDGEVVGIFHCDHVHIYPEIAGTVDLEFHLWHVDHSDDHTDPLTVRVGEPAGEN